MANNQTSAAVAAIKELGILSGLRIERRENLNRSIDDLSDEELMEMGRPRSKSCSTICAFAHAGVTNCLAKLIEKHDANPIEMFDAYKEMLKLRAMAQEAAKDAAPYRIADVLLEDLQYRSR